MRLRVVSTLLAVCALMFAGQAWADSPLHRGHSSAEIQAAEENGSVPTDPEAAGELPLRDLDREAASDLLEGVFGPVLDSSTGIFDDLQVERFLSSTSAVISSSEVAQLDGEGAESADNDGSMLLESTLPLRAEGRGGDVEPVDLDLEHVFGDLRPANPLIDLSIPSQLGDGIALPETGVQIAVAGAPEDRAPSMIGDSTAFYPNVASDTDFAVSPTATGVETLTQLRSADAPTSQTLDLDLPDGAVLEATPDGGATATLNGGPLLDVLPPTAIDANGDLVPVTLDVDGSSLTVTVTPGANAAFPIAVDPFFQDTYNWPNTGYAGWVNNWKEGINVGEFNQPTYGCSTFCYLKVSARPNAYAANLQSYWSYSVPRFFSDYEDPAIGQRPTSWIQSFGLENINFFTLGDYQANPQALFAVSDGGGAWQSAALKPPNQTGNYLVNLNNNHTGKFASFGLFAAQTAWLTTERYMLVGGANVVLGDETAPSIGELAVPWLGNEPKPVNYKVEDAGLGIYAVTVRNSSGTVLGTYSVGCTGSAKSVCPRTLKGGPQSWNVVSFNPSGLPQGANALKFEATDPVGNSVSTLLEVMVDHTAPTLTISGSATEQGWLGTTRPQYTLKTEAKDGTAGSPQSGIAKTEVKVDGKLVSTDPSWSPGCPSQNCSLTKELVLKASEYAAGKHTIEVVTVDGAGIKSAPKTVTIEFQPDTTKPTLFGSGSLVNGPEGWIEQKTYSLTANASDPDGYGVTTLELKVDNTTVGTSPKSCPAGGCGQSKAFSLNTGTIKGGDHVVKLIAADGAGNKSEKEWEIYVDPKGSVQAQEATETLEAFEETTEAQPVASTEEFLEPGVIEAGDDPGFKKVNGEYEATGIPIEATVGSTPAEGFTIEGEDGMIEVTPVSPGGGSEMKLAGEESVAVGPGLASGVDTLVRAEFNGLMNFQAIREPASPEKFSWQINMGAGQSLQLVDAEHAKVVYASGNTAFSIAAEPAHDATGKGVPTHIEVSGSVLSLVVEHKAGGVVYPVVAGAAYETSYIMPTVIEDTVWSGPPIAEESDPPPPPWSAVKDEHALDFGAEPLVVNAPDFTGKTEYTFTIYRSLCGKSCGRWKAKIYNAAVEVGPWGARWESGTKVMASVSQDPQWALLLMADAFNCGARPPTVVHKGSNEHLSAWAHFNVTKNAQTELKGLETFKPGEKNFTLEAWVWPNGWQERQIGGWNGAAPHNCPTVAAP